MLEEVLKAHKPDEAWFWATHAGVEIKRMDAPRLTPSMKIAMEDLRLDELLVVYPGGRRYGLAAGVEVVPVLEMLAW